MSVRAPAALQTRDAQRLRRHIRDIPDFPTKGILFRDITPLLQEGKAFQRAIKSLAALYRSALKRPDAIVAIESRGLIVGSALAYALGIGIVPVRKAGKLPHKTYRAPYALEYGKSTLEIHRDALKRGDRVVIVDDLLATGGTLGATIRLVKRCGARVLDIACLIELTDLKGRHKLSPHPVSALIQY